MTTESEPRPSKINAIFYTYNEKGGHLPVVGELHLAGMEVQGLEQFELCHGILHYPTIIARGVYSCVEELNGGRFDPRFELSYVRGSLGSKLIVGIMPRSYQNKNSPIQRVLEGKDESDILIGNGYKLDLGTILLRSDKDGTKEGWNNVSKNLERRR